MSVLVLLATVGLALLAAWGRPVVTLSVLVATTLLLPSTLLVPGSPTGILTCSRLVEAGAVVGVLVARRRQPVPGRAPGVLLVLLAYLGVCAVTGLGLADRLTDPVEAAYGWVVLAEEAVVLLLAIDLGRRLRSSQVLLVLATGAVAAGLVGLAEAVTHESWARLLFRAVPEQLTSGPAAPLEQRSGGVRVRGAGDFALSYGWLLAALLPAVCLAVPVLRRLLGDRRWLPALAGPPVVVGAALLTRTRSSLLGLVVLAVVLVVLVAPRTTWARVGTAAAGAITLLTLAPWVAAQVSRSVDTGSVDVRVQRLPEVLALGAQRPFEGVGITGVRRLGLGGVDASYVLVYVESGAIAVTLLVLALVAALVAVGRGLPAVPGEGGALREDRLLVVAAGLGMAALVVAAATFDVFTVLASERLFWLLCGVGLAAAERRRPLPAAARVREVLTLRRVAVVVLAVAAGFAVRAAVPQRSAVTVVLATLDVQREVLDDPPGLGRTLLTTACQATRDVVQPGQRWTVGSCTETDPPGWGRLRLEAPDRATAEQAVGQLEGLREVPGLERVRVAVTSEGPVRAVPTVARVAPAVLGLVALVGVLLVPVRRRADGPDEGLTSGTHHI